MTEPDRWPLLPQEPVPSGVSDPVLPTMVSADMAAALGRPGYQADDPLVLSASWNNEVRRGRWTVPPFIQVVPTGSNVVLDFLTVTSAPPVIRLSVIGGLGTAVVIVPLTWGVNTERLGKSIGSVSNKVSPEPEPGYPLIVVIGGVGLGGFKARHANWFDRRRLRKQAVAALEAGPA